MVLKIREFQLVELEDVRDESILVEVFRFARREMPELVGHLSDERLRMRISEHDDYAETFGIEDPQRRFEFLFLALLCGEPAFYLNEEVYPYFGEDDSDPEEQTRLMLADVIRIAEQGAMADR